MRVFLLLSIVQYAVGTDIARVKDACDPQYNMNIVLHPDNVIALAKTEHPTSCQEYCERTKYCLYWKWDPRVDYPCELIKEADVHRVPFATTISGGPCAAAAAKNDRLPEGPPELGERSTRKQRTSRTTGGIWSAQGEGVLSMRARTALGGEMPAAGAEDSYTAVEEGDGNIQRTANTRAGNRPTPRDADAGSRPIQEGTAFGKGVPELCIAPSNISTQHIVVNEQNLSSVTGFRVIAACMSGYAGSLNATKCREAGSPYAIKGKCMPAVARNGRAAVGEENGNIQRPLNTTAGKSAKREEAETAVASANSETTSSGMKARKPKKKEAFSLTDLRILMVTSAGVFGFLFLQALFLTCTICRAPSARLS